MDDTSPQESAGQARAKRSRDYLTPEFQSMMRARGWKPLSRNDNIWSNPQPALQCSYALKRGQTTTKLHLPRPYGNSTSLYIAEACFYCRKLKKTCELAGKKTGASLTWIPADENDDSMSGQQQGEWQRVSIKDRTSMQRPTTLERDKRTYTILTGSDALQLGKDTVGMSKDTLLTGIGQIADYMTLLGQELHRYNEALRNMEVEEEEEN